jgi:hypothetical protein
MVVWATLPGRLGKESCKLGISAWLVGHFPSTSIKTIILL